MYLRKRGKESYRVEAWVKGERARFTIRATTKAQATAIARVELAKREKQYNNKLEGRHTLSEAFERWQLEDMPPSAYPKIRLVYHAIGDTYLDAVPAEFATLIAKWQSDGLRPTTINRRIAQVKRVTKLAWERWEWIETPVHQKIKTLSEANTAREYFLSVDEVYSVLDLCRPAVREFLLCAAYTGLRPWSELIRLLPNDFDGRRIHVRRSKSGRSRYVPVAGEIGEILGRNLPWPVSESTIKRDWYAAKKELNHPWRIYDLRHTFASWLAKDPETPLTVIRDILGHSTLAMTSRYAKLRDESLREAVDRLPQPSPTAVPN